MKTGKVYSGVKLLLINNSTRKVAVSYNDNMHAYWLPEIGARPPYYYHPRYEPHYPVI